MLWTIFSYAATFLLGGICGVALVALIYISAPDDYYDYDEEDD